MKTLRFHTVLHRGFQIRGIGAPPSGWSRVSECWMISTFGGGKHKFLHRRPHPWLALGIILLCPTRETRSTSWSLFPSPASPFWPGRRQCPGVAMLCLWLLSFAAAGFLSVARCGVGRVRKFWRSIPHMVWELTTRGDPLQIQLPSGSCRRHLSVLRRQGWFWVSFLMNDRSSWRCHFSCSRHTSILSWRRRTWNLKGWNQPHSHLNCFSKPSSVLLPARTCIEALAWVGKDPTGSWGHPCQSHAVYQGHNHAEYLVFWLPVKILFPRVVKSPALGSSGSSLKFWHCQRGVPSYLVQLRWQKPLSKADLHGRIACGHSLAEDWLEALVLEPKPWSVRSIQPLRHGFGIFANNKFSIFFLGGRVDSRFFDWLAVLWWGLQHPFYLLHHFIRNRSHWTQWALIRSLVTFGMSTAVFVLGSFTLSLVSRGARFVWAWIFWWPWWRFNFDGSAFLSPSMALWIRHCVQRVKILLWKS